MLKVGLGIDYREVPDDEHIVITSNVIIGQSPNKKYFKLYIQFYTIIKNLLYYGKFLGAKIDRFVNEIYTF